jgi:hypothetical protein
MKEITMLDGYKTYLAAALLAAFGVLAQQDWTTLLNHPNAAAWTAIGSAVLMAVMRAITQVTTVQKALDTEPPKKGK